MSFLSPNSLDVSNSSLSSTTSSYSSFSSTEDVMDRRMISRSLSNNIIDKIDFNLNPMARRQTKSDSMAVSPMFDPIRYKTEMCKNYEELGRCRFGTKCFYAHCSDEKRLATYKHRKHKTQLCKPFHEEGYCDFGSRCAFIHSKPDINDIVNKLKTFLDSRHSLPVFQRFRECPQN